MALLEQINELKTQGRSDTEIIQTLTQQGNNPKEITEALSQSQIKSAISQPPTNDPTQTAQQAQDPTQQTQAPAQTPQTNEMQPSIAQQQTTQQIPTPEAAQPQVQAQPQTMQPQDYAQAYQQPAAYQDQTQAYQQQGYEGYYQQSMDLETIRDLSSQIIEEQMEALKAKINELTKLKTELNFQIQNIDNRLTKLEDNIDAIQHAILKKVGTYGQAIEDLNKNLESTQESFSKLADPIIDSKRNLTTDEEPEQTEESQETTTSKAKKKPKTPREDSSAPGFEDYFR